MAPLAATILRCAPMEAEPSHYENGQVSDLLLPLFKPEVIRAYIQNLVCSPCPLKWSSGPDSSIQSDVTHGTSVPAPDIAAALVAGKRFKFSAGCAPLYPVSAEMEAANREGFTYLEHLFQRRRFSRRRRGIILGVVLRRLLLGRLGVLGRRRVLLLLILLWRRWRRFLLLFLWRGRRHAAPVVEHQW